MTALDRLLCERLGIPPAVEAGQAEQIGGGYSVVRKAPRYPALSTTGDGMVLLMDKLCAGGWNPCVGAHSYGKTPRKHWYASLYTPLTGESASEEDEA